MIPLLIDGDRSARALYAELVTPPVFEAVTDAIARFRRDIVAVICETQIIIADRAKAETDPDLPDSMRWLRTAARGSWIVAIRADGMRVRARLRMAAVTRGGDA